MATQSSPVITDMKVIPVAGHDSMLLNIGGAHNAYFTRNIVVLTDNAGHTGIGEAPGGEVIYQTLVDAIPMVLGQEVARLNKVVQQVHKGNQAADFDTFGKGAWTFELRVNAVAALEAALLDLLGKALNVPVCELLGPGKQRDAITVLGYLFYIGDRTKTGFAPIFPDICYHLTHYKPAAADIPVASDNPAHYADAIRYNARTPLQGSLLPLTRLVWA